MRLFALRRAVGALATVSALALAAACGGQNETPAPGGSLADGAEAPRAYGPKEAPAGPATVEDARAFIDRVEKTYAELNEAAARTYWVQATYINYDTNWLATQMSEKLTQVAVDFANETKRFDGLDLPADLKRKMDMVRAGITLPAPTAEGAAGELAEITTRLSAVYSTGKIEFEGETVPQDETEVLMRTLRDPAKLAEVWTKWREVAKAMKADYVRLVEIANEGARELGFSDVGEMWRSGYDMEPDAFAEEVDRLWGQVKPLYDELHCHVRAKLNERYGDAVVPLDQPIRADLLGNMWAQSWAPLADIVAPEGAGEPIDLDALLVEKGYTPEKMTRTAEAFFASLGFEPLPETFWERSQIVKPEGREVVCHASAWNLDDKDDLRIKMCTKVNAEDFRTLHHELGHNFYQRAYKEQSTLHRAGAHDGFHEAIGDMIALSITPEYLKQIGLIEEVPDADADLGLLMSRALDKIAFLPFGLVVDKWRWQAFSGALSPDQYNDGWWALRTQYQGIRPPAERGADAFDPGSKYHVPNNVPYMRYFLAHILQFQFYKAACDQIGWEGPLHRCSFYGSKEVGEKFKAMLEMGASRPWPEALEAFTGSRQMDGSAVVEYFAPLMDWLKEQNADRQCGW
ncbi:M2 family metallopeptidase [Amphiplicatus metriothermophilus]|uniref:Peptidyl-dipeptidase A n=1 Tax=Amphiplicatus metriothermophilus TaxID=1519374 RepID=A0A239PL20_9PROT|nr:M2 family metallopeptidase [Amphiplicatus metriothermophilus]MBB5517647.1 peptidyl-dipeptidase A [Amphiplicatus metriothermophilus]SNT68019.1 peptidyl-dipeptidase A [Amphiplicatus metriothermophilus]